MAGSFSLNETILRQYVASTNMRTIIEMMWKAVRGQDFEDAFYDNIWNIETANSHGLDIWGAIVNLSRVMSYSTTNLYFGFNEAELDEITVNDPQPFNTYPFYDPSSVSGGTVVLSDDYYRKAIMMKAMTNITDCTPPKINSMLMYMFSDSGNAWVTHDGPMKMSYHFDFTPNTTELAIIQNGNILPRPAGCVTSFVFETS